MDSGLAIEVVALVIELETAMDSLFVCINAAMEVEGFAPACSGGRTKATAISEVMLESVGGIDGNAGEDRKKGSDRLHPETILIEVERGDAQVDRRGGGGGKRQRQTRSRLESEVQGVWGVSFSPGNRVWRKLTRLVSALHL